MPLRKLRGQGLIKKLIEERISVVGESYVGRIEIVGDIDPDA